MLYVRKEAACKAHDENERKKAESDAKREGGTMKKGTEIHLQRNLLFHLIFLWFGSFGSVKCDGHVQQERTIQIRDETKH